MLMMMVCEKRLNTKKTRQKRAFFCISPSYSNVRPIQAYLSSCTENSQHIKNHAYTDNENRVKIKTKKSGLFIKQKADQIIQLGLKFQ